MLVTRVLSLAAVVVFAAAAVANGLDRESRDVPGVARLVPAPFRAQSDRAAAASALDRKDTAAGLAISRDAVARDPVDPDATPFLGSALMQAGRTQDAERTFRVAAKFGWRNVQTQAFWYEVALQAGIYDVAAERLDALLRVHPQLVGQPELLQPMESDPAARKVLAGRLRLQPPWLAEYLRLGDDTPSDVLDRRLSVISDLNASRVAVGCDTVAPITRTLLVDGRRRDAETIWNGNCPSLKVAGLIADPTFADVLDPNAKSPFSWRVMSSGDLSIKQDSIGGARNLVLANSAPGTRLALIQTVDFPAGLYRFHASQSGGGSAGAGKLYISWACNDRPPFPGVSGGELLGSGQDIAVSACDRQQLGLWVSGGGAPARLNSIHFEKIG